MTSRKQCVGETSCLTPAKRAPEGCIWRPSAPRADANKATNARYAVSCARPAATTRLLATASTLAASAALTDSAFTGGVLAALSRKCSGECSATLLETCAASVCAAGPSGRSSLTGQAVMMEMYNCEYISDRVRLGPVLVSINAGQYGSRRRTAMTSTSAAIAAARVVPCGSPSATDTAAKFTLPPTYERCLRYVDSSDSH